MEMKRLKKHEKRGVNEEGYKVYCTYITIRGIVDIVLQRSLDESTTWEVSLYYIVNRRLYIYVR